MLTSFGARVDFDMDKTLHNLTALQAQPTDGTTGDGGRALLTAQPDGHLQVLPLSEAKQLIDHIWDNAFTYAKH